jgi:membrane protease YdiL (CAAX protease family)
MPRSRDEIPLAHAAGVLGGTGEEIAYRGFLIWYAQAFLGLPLAVLATSLLFGLAHGYQSKFGMLFATIAGLILAGVYLLSGSLLLAVWLHASYNVASFTLGYRLLSADRGTAKSSAPPIQS